MGLGDGKLTEHQYVKVFPFLILGWDTLPHCILTSGVKAEQMVGHPADFYGSFSHSLIAVYRGF